MAYKINGTEVIDDNGDLVNFSAYNLNNDDGQIEIQSNSPMVGTVSGYSSGGFPRDGAIRKFPFATDTNSSFVGSLTVSRDALAGQSSTTHGYTSAGGVGPATGLNTIDKFPFAVDTNATDVGNLTRTSYAGSIGQSSFTHGYTSGGYINPGGGYTAQNTIDKFPFSADSNATDVGDLTTIVHGGSSQSSSTFGYVSGGVDTSIPAPPTYINIIQKFSFSVDNNASDVGDLLSITYNPIGQSSTTHGYASGGSTSPGTALDTIQKFPFSSDTNSSDVGDLTVARRNGSGQSSILSGYTSGGFSDPTPATVNTIDKFPFATDGNATDVGDLSAAKNGIAGHQD